MIATEISRMSEEKDRKPKSLMDVMDGSGRAIWALSEQFEALLSDRERQIFQLGRDVERQAAKVAMAIAGLREPK